MAHRVGSSSSFPSRRGFTLVELAVVLAILAILAALLVPRIAFLRTMSTYASGATELQDTIQNMLTFHATQARWPDHFDSLCEGGTGLYGSTTGDTYGLDSGLKKVVKFDTLSASEKKSLAGLLGLSTSSPVMVMDHVQTVTTPGNSGTTARNINDTDLSAAIVDNTQAADASDPNAAAGAVVYNSVFPSGQPTDHTERIVALGVGPMCTAVNKTIITPPAMYMKDGTRYNRIIILVRVRSDGVQASLAGGITPDGRTLDQNLGNYRVTAER